ncbi:hypothetical protein BC940DRAFT_249003 [Gongronella butleri]|nr:hypothetical protein BC940DRAFT_249003 [Gongronella butleri]
MSSIEHLTSLLKDLNAGPTSLATLDPKALVTDIATIATSEVSDKDLEYVTSLLLDSQTGIVSFVYRNANTRDLAINSAQTLTFEFLGTWTSKVKSMMQMYLQRIKNLCVHLSNYGSARTRCAALNLLTTLLKSHDYLDTSGFNKKALFDKYSFEFRASKTPQTVQSAMRELLAVLAEQDNGELDLMPIKTLMRNCMDIATQQLQSDAADNVPVSSSLIALNHLFNCSRLNIQPAGQEATRAYELIKKTIAIPDGIARFDIPLAALSLFKDHINLFASFLTADYDVLYKHIFFCCSHQNRDVSKLGYRTMEVLFKQLGSQLASTTGDTQEQRVFEFFMSRFTSMLQQDHDKLEFQPFTIAVRGIGYFAQAANLHLQRREMEQLQDHLIKKGMWFFSEANVDREKLIEHLPSFIQAYTLFIEHCPDTPAAMMNTMSKMADVYVLQFTRLSIYRRMPGALSLQALIKSLFAKGEGTLRRFLSSFFHSTLVATCAEKQSVPGESTQNYQELTFLWLKLLNHRYTGDDTMDDALLTILYDEFISGVMSLIKMFNLDVKKAANTKQGDDNDNAQDDTDGNETIDFSNTLAEHLQPVNQNDFLLFQNLIDFWTSFLPQLDNSRLPDWIDVAGATLIRMSMEKPLISGFYRVIATILAITDNMGLFYNCKERHEHWSVEDIKTDLDDTYSMFYDYLHQVWHRMKQFKDELWVACLRLILSSPLQFFDLQQLVSPLQMALRIGLSYSPMVVIALDTLEGMIDPSSDVYQQVIDDSYFLKALLPCFNDYLVISTTAGEDAEQQQQKQSLVTDTGASRANKSTQTTYKKMTARQSRYQHLHRKITAEELGVTGDSSDAWDRYNIQLRVMRFLGHLGGLNKQLVSHKKTHVDATGDERPAEQDLVTWDADRQLTIHLPFPNAGVQLPMDELLPRICELAESSPERHVKVAASELLHGVVLVMIGNSAFQARDRADTVVSKYYRIYQHVFPVIVRLAIDVDRVVRDMYHALVFQLIHWLTNNAQYESPDTILLLQTCLDASGGASSAALRDFGATCIYEFVKWSIKQTNPEAIHGPMNIKSLFKRLYHMAMHPSATKRVGASLIFNRIYRLVREEASIVDEYTFELLSHFMFSLRMAEDDQPSLGTQQQARESISHLKRILRVKSAIFATASPNRRSFSGTDQPDMPSVVGWAFEQIGTPQRQYAKTCIDFFAEFVSAVPGVSSGREWLKARLESDAQFLVTLLEKSSLSVPSTWHLGEYLSWQNQLQIALDGYVWVLERGILDVDAFVACLGHSKLCDALVDLFETRPQDIPATRQDKAALHDQIKCAALHTYNSYRFIYLVNVLLAAQDQDGACSRAVTALNPALELASCQNMASDMLVLPSVVMDRLQRGESALVPWLDTASLHTTAVRFLRRAKRSIPLKDDFLPKVLQAVVNHMMNDIALYELNTYSVNWKVIKEGIHALEALRALDLLESLCYWWHHADPENGPSSARDLSNTLFDLYRSLRHTTNEPQKVEILGTLMLFTFDQPETASKHARNLLEFSDTPLSEQAEKDRLKLFERYVEFNNQCIARHFASFVPCFVDQLDTEYVQHIVISLMDYMKKRCQAKQFQEGNAFGRELLSSPTFLKAILLRWNCPDKYDSLVKVMQSLLVVNPELIRQAKDTPASELLADIMVQLLDHRYSLQLKADALDLLPFYLQVPGPHIQSLQHVLETMVRMQFSTDIADLTTGSAIFNHTVLALEKLLSMMANFHSVLLFEILLPVLLQNHGSVYEAIVQPCLQKFASGLDASGAKTSFSLCFDQIKEGTLQQRLRAVELLLAMVPCVPREVMLAFFEANVVYMMDLIKEESNPFDDDDEKIAKFNAKTCCYKLLQALYELGSVRQLHSPESKVAAAWEKHIGNQNQGRMLTIKIVEFARRDVVKSFRTDNRTLDKARLQFQQAAFNALAVTIMRTQNNEKYYVGLLFSEKNDEHVWRHIFDLSLPLNLEVQFKKPLLTSRLEDFRAKSGFRSTETNPSNVAYMQSIGLTGSSLDVASLSNVALDALGPNGDKASQSASMRASAPTQDDTSASGVMRLAEDEEQGVAIRDESELEMDKFNQNPCMRVLCAVIRRLTQLLTPADAPATTTGDNPMPEWMKEMHRVFKAQSTSITIRLFLAKLVINCPDVFERYAFHWITPLIELLVRGNQYGEPMNYFVQDICVLVLAWGSSVSFSNSPEDRGRLFRLVNYLMINAPAAKPNVSRNNVQAIKGVFDNWYKDIIIPTKTIYDLICSDEENRCLTGLQLAGVVLAHELDLLYNGPEVPLGDLTEAKFFTAILRLIAPPKPKRSVSAAASEVVAWALSLMKRRNRQDALQAEIEKHLITQVDNLDPIVKNKSLDPGFFLTALYRVHLHDDALCESHMTRVFFLLPQVTNNILVQTIEIINGCTRPPVDIYKELRLKGLSRMITQRNEKTQSAILKVLMRISKDMTDEHIKEILDDLVVAFSDHSNDECRNVYYKVLHQFYDGLEDFGLRNKVKVHILRGLIDSSPSIRMSNTLFIQGKVGMTNDIFDCSKKVFGELYMAPVENIYILYATQMLLQVTKEGYEYNTTVFADPLPNARFDEHVQKLDTSWRNSTSMAPLFVATQANDRLTNDQIEARIRQTQQSLQFSQTQAGTSLLSSSFGVNANTQAPNLSATTSLAAGLSGPAQFRLGSAPDNQQEENAAENPQEARRRQYKQLRRRFIETSDEDTRGFFIHRNARLKKDLAYYQQIQKEARAKKVSMLRSYRVGELPDIQIKYSELIEPLQTVGRADLYVARILFTSILVATTSKMSEKDGLKREFTTGLVDSIETNLQSSSKFFSPSIGAFLRIFYEIGDRALNSSLVRMASERSLNHHLGIAVLESQIFRDYDAKEEPPAKRSRRDKRAVSSQPTADKAHWIDLASLYKAIDEPEIYESLYRTRVVELEAPRLAVEAQLRGDVAEACEKYQDAMQHHFNEASSAEYKVWEQERLACFEQLTQWHDVAFSTLADLPNGTDDLWSRQYQVPYLHHFMQSFSKLRDGQQDDKNQLVPWSDSNPNPIFGFIDSATESPSHLDYLLHHHAPEMALASLMKADYDHARFCVSKSYESLHDTWTSLHPLANGSRLKQLAQLQRTVELEDFLSMVSEAKRGTLTDEHLANYMKHLCRTYPDAKLDAMNTWDDVIDSRSVYLSHLDTLTKDAPALDESRLAMVGTKSEFSLAMVAAARQQNNFNVANLQLKQLTLANAIDIPRRNFIILQMDCQRASLSHARQASLSHSAQVGLLARSLYFMLKLDSEIDDLDKTLLTSFHLTAGNAIQGIRECLQRDDKDYAAFQNHKSLTKFLEKSGDKMLKQLNKKDIQTFVNTLTQFGYDQLRMAQEEAEADQSSNQLAESLWKYGDYCDKVLIANENKNSKLTVDVDTDDYSQLVVKCYFEAMQLGHMQAVEHFPRLLELIERYPKTGPVFKQHASKQAVIWYYIRWIPQLVAILDRPSTQYVLPILFKLAETYPSALYYPLQISNEHYECYKDQLDPDNYAAIQRIKSIITSPLQEVFTNELRRLTNPEHIVKDFIDLIVSVGQKSDVNSTFMEDAYAQFSELLLDPSNRRLGAIPRAFALRHGSQLRSLLCNRGGINVAMTEQQRAKLNKFYQSNIQNDKEKAKAPPEQLRSYSPWLAEFQSTNHAEQIEIPGQYHGRSAPNPDAHIKIAKFDERLLVMSSLRKPKRLCIYGTDGKEYPFLVKGGEDLRLDQRIQQLFGVMNELIRKEPYAAQHDVELKTYNVIPMSTNIGMIEWVNNTKPLRNCIVEEFGNNRVMLRAQEGYRNFVAKFKGDVMGYHNLLRAPRNPVVTNFQQLTEQFPLDILRGYLLKLASSPEAFIFMRNKYAHDLAAISIAGYLLGIGDRHLENIMINKTNGSLLAIDFGHAFGSATELLPVPEMMPFRLTRQLVGVLEPLGITGILEVAMTHILDGIISEKEVLLNVMDVFVKEPLLDWKKTAAKRAKSQKRGEAIRSAEFSADSAGASTGSASMEYGWYPAEKLATAKQKLDGVNPAVIMSEELRRGHESKAYYKHALQIIKGDPSINVRATIPDQCSNTAQQVQCLVDLATDPNILGRTWVGWQSYI